MPAIGRGRSIVLPGEDTIVTDQNALANEGNYISAACHRLPSMFNDTLDPIELLARLQHFGIPTRLLDVTTNALAALYFACSGCQAVERERDGEVLIFRCPSYDLIDYPIVQAIADSWRILPNAKELSDFIDVAMNQPYFRYQEHMLRRVSVTGGSLPDWLRQCCEKPLFVRGSVSLGRQLSQSGMYILFPNSIDERSENGGLKGRRMSFRSKIEAISKGDNSIAADLIVDAGSKKGILKELQSLGITEGSLFPDNIDAVCRDIKNAVDA